MRPVFLVSFVLIAVSSGCGTAAFAADSCSGFKWDVGKEHALFMGPNLALPVGRDVVSAPPIGANRLYQLQLLPQPQVSFVLAPGKKMPADAVYAGVAILQVEGPGNYRVSVDASLWIDVVADGKLATVVDYQGQPSCDAPHKIVEFSLTGARQYVLQVSGSAEAVVRLTVTPATAPNT